MKVRKWFRQSIAARSLLRQSLGRAKTPEEHQARQLAARVLDLILDGVEEYYTVDKMDAEVYKRRFSPLAKEIAHLDDMHRWDVQMRVMRALSQLFFMVFVHSAAEKRHPVEMYRRYVNMILWSSFQAGHVLGSVYGLEELAQRLPRAEGG